MSYTGISITKNIKDRLDTIRAEMNKDKQYNISYSAFFDQILPFLEEKFLTKENANKNSTHTENNQSA